MFKKAKNPQNAYTLYSSIHLSIVGPIDYPSTIALSSDTRETNNSTEDSGGKGGAGERWVYTADT